jgi:hypothetical protein
LTFSWEAQNVEPGTARALHCPKRQRDAGEDGMILELALLSLLFGGMPS